MKRIQLSEKISLMWAKSRCDAGKSQEYVAKALGISKRTIQNWESGEASPNFRMALEWFDALGIPMYPYIMSLIYPNELAGITAHSDMKELREALHIYIDELDDQHVRELLFLLYGKHGSSPTGTLDLITAYLHLPLADRVCLASNLLTTYEVNQSLGMIEDKEHVLPKLETLKRCVSTAKQAVMAGKRSYTIAEEKE